jgi:hypothetical protein
MRPQHSKDRRRVKSRSGLPGKDYLIPNDEIYQ